MGFSCCHRRLDSIPCQTHEMRVVPRLRSQLAVVDDGSPAAAAGPARRGRRLLGCVPVCVCLHTYRCGHPSARCFYFMLQSYGRHVAGAMGPGVGAGVVLRSSLFL